MKKTKIVIVALTMAVLAVVALISLAAWACNSPAVPLRDLKTVYAGMPKSEVRSILGDPDQEKIAINLPGSWPDEESYRRDHETASHWWYRSPFKWYSLRIDFAEDETVIRYVHDD